jgi:hypothetical protein
VTFAGAWCLFNTLWSSIYKCVCARDGDDHVSLIYRIHHQKSRYVYELFYKRKAISRGKLEPEFL